MPLIGPLIGIGTSLIGGLMGKKQPQPGSIDKTETTNKTEDTTQTVAPWLSDYIQSSINGNSPVYRGNVAQGFSNTADVFKQGGQLANGALNHSGFGGAPSGIQAALMNEVTNRAGTAEANYSSQIVNDEEKRKQAMALGALPSYTNKSVATNGTVTTKGTDMTGQTQAPSNPFASALTAAGGILNSVIPAQDGGGGPSWSNTEPITATP